jgi:hypothetical protein
MISRRSFNPFDGSIFSKIGQKAIKIAQATLTKLPL